MQYRVRPGLMASGPRAWLCNITQPDNGLACVCRGQVADFAVIIAAERDRLEKYAALCSMTCCAIHMNTCVLVLVAADHRFGLGLVPANRLCTVHNARLVAIFRATASAM